MADAFRYANFILAVLVIATFPMTAWVQGRRRSAWLAIAGSELIYLAVLMGSLANLGEPYHWRLPIVTLSGLCYLAFAGAVFLGWDRHMFKPRGAPRSEPQDP